MKTLKNISVLLVSIIVTITVVYLFSVTTFVKDESLVKEKSEIKS